jgi:hypothetical protein
MKHRFISSSLASAVLLAGASAIADVSVVWTAPADGSVFPVGTLVNPVGAATASGVIGGTAGLDLALVLDSSGSMTTVNSGKSRQQWQRDAAIALVNALPQLNTSVSVVEFDSDANTVRTLTPLVPDKNLVIDAINAVDASGSTTIGAGISLAGSELTGSNHTTGRNQVMVVISDGSSSGSPGESADSAALLGVDQIHSVGIPGHVVATMRSIVDGFDDNFAASSDNHGTYTGFSTGDDLNGLIALFSGTGGSLVGLSSVDVTLPNGTVLNSVQDGLGNFTVPTIGSWPIQAGPNVFTALATATDGSTASATLTLFGRQQSSTVPDAGHSLALLGLGVFGLLPLSRRFRR